MRRKPKRQRDGASTFLEDPSRRAEDARILWRDEHHPGVVTVDALPNAAGHPDSFSIEQAGVGVDVIQSPGGEQLLLSDGKRRLQLSVREGTLLGGPVRFRYALEGLRTLGPKLLTLRRLLALSRHGRFTTSLFPPDQRAARWIMMLRAVDGLRAGATQREIASAVFGAQLAEKDWRTRSDYLRLRTQRLIRTGEAMILGGYFRLLHEE